MSETVLQDLRQLQLHGAVLVRQSNQVQVVGLRVVD